MRSLLGLFKFSSRGPNSVGKNQFKLVQRIDYGKVVNRFTLAKGPTHVMFLFPLSGRWRLGPDNG